MASRTARVFEPIIMAIFGFIFFNIGSNFGVRLRMFITVAIVFCIIWFYKFLTLFNLVV